MRLSLQTGVISSALLFSIFLNLELAMGSPRGSQNRPQHIKFHSHIKIGPRMLNRAHAMAALMRSHTMALFDFQNEPGIFSPAAIKSAYGFPNEGAQAGAGQTIGIIDPYVIPADVIADTQAFSKQFGLPDANIQIDSSLVNSLSKNMNTTSGSNRILDFQTYLQVLNDPAMLDNAYEYTNFDLQTIASWQGEIALDVEWSHAIAPAANILIVAAPTDSLEDLSAAVKLMSSQYSGKVNQVSMSFGAPDHFLFLRDLSDFETSFASGKMVFFASSGDAGEVDYPASSQNVVAVGGTSLSSNGETAWSDKDGAGGGGLSAIIPKPDYQNFVVVPEFGTSFYNRVVPDVSYDSDPETGFHIYTSHTSYVDSVNYANGTMNGFRGWYSIGGTSAASPQWAGIMAIINAHRASAGLPPLTGGPRSLYTAGSIGYSSSAVSTKSLFNDITTGSNSFGSFGYNATIGFDEATGFGSPKVNQLVGYFSDPNCFTTAAVNSIGCNPYKLAATAVPNRAVWLRSEEFPKYGAADGTLVNTWGDLNDPGIYAQQFNTANQPIWKQSGINGEPAVLFSGNQYLNFAKPGLQPIENSDYSIFTVFQKLAPGPGAILSGSTQAENENLVLAFRDTRWLTFAQYSNDLDAAVPDSGPQLIEARFDHTSGHMIYRNGVPIASNANLSPLTFMDPGEIGRHLGPGTSYPNGVWYFNGYIGETIVFKSAVSDSDRSTLENYLMTKFHLQ